MGCGQGVVQGKSLLRQRQRALQGLGVRTPAQDPLHPVGPTQPRVRLGILRVQGNGFLKHLPCLGIGLFREAAIILHPAQEGVIGLQVVRVFAHDVPLLLQRELQLQRRHDLLHDLILQRKDVLQRAVIALGPQVIAGRGIDQLRGDPHLLARFLHTAFQHVPYAQSLCPRLAPSPLCLCR